VEHSIRENVTWICDVFLLKDLVFFKCTIYFQIDDTNATKV
jgi:hypothetical protein